MFLDGCTPELVTLIKMVKLALGIIQIVVPILLIVMGSLDLAKAVATQDDKVMKSTMAKFSMIVSTNVQNSGSDTGLGTFTSCWNAE